MIASHGAAHLRERDVQLLYEAISARSARECALMEALSDLDRARVASGDADTGPGVMGLLAWVGVSKEQLLAAVNTAVRHRR